MWGYIWKSLLVMLVGLVIAELTRPKPEHAKPQDLEDFKTTTASPERNIPVIWGKPINTSTNNIWYGDVKSEKIEERVVTGRKWYGKKTYGNQTVGHNYYAGFHLALNVHDASTKLQKVWYGDTLCFSSMDIPCSACELANCDTCEKSWDCIECKWWNCPHPNCRRRSHDPQRCWVCADWVCSHCEPVDHDCPDCAALTCHLCEDQRLHGVDEGVYRADNFKKPNAETAGTGVRGDFEFYPGGVETPVSPYLQKAIDDKIPTFKHLAHIVLKQVLIGETMHPEPFAVQLQRLPNELKSGYHNIGGHANPAEILYECLVNSEWGLGMPPSQINIETFKVAAKTLYEENFGLSLMWTQASELESIVNEVNKHVDSVLYADNVTGELVYTLIRADESTDGLLELNARNITELKTYSRPSLDEVTNEVKVVYSDLESLEDDRVMQVQDLGNYRALGGQFVSTQIQYPGIADDELAAKIATRDLRNMSYPTLKATLSAFNISETLNPGDRFLLTWEPLGVHEVVMRVMDIDFGNLESGGVEIEAVQDVYALGSAFYPTPPSSGHTPPIQRPTHVSHFKVLETPYWLLRYVEEFTNPEVIRPNILAESPVPVDLGYTLMYSEIDDVYVDVEGSQPFTPLATLKNRYGLTNVVDTSGVLILEDVIGELINEDTDIVRKYGANLVQIGDEIIAFNNVTRNSDGSWRVGTCWRGLLDTVMSEHDAGTGVWFLSDYGTVDKTFSPSDTVNFKLLTNTPSGVLSLDRAPALPFEMTNRATRPYPVARLLINNSYTPDLVTGSIKIDYRWRNRVTQKEVIPQSDSSITPESGTTARIRFYNLQGELKKEVKDITGTSYTLTETEEKEDNDGEYFGTYDVEVMVIRDGVEAYQSERKKFQREQVYATGDLYALVDSLQPTAYWRLEE